MISPGGQIQLEQMGCRFSDACHYRAIAIFRRWAAWAVRRLRPTQFRHEFKEVMFLGPIEYLLGGSIAFARGHLFDEIRTGAEVALLLGFAGPHHASNRSLLREEAVQGPAEDPRPSCRAVQ